jgi:hypothetical protein
MSLLRDRCHKRKEDRPHRGGLSDEVFLIRLGQRVANLHPWPQVSRGKIPEFSECLFRNVISLEVSGRPKRIEGIASTLSLTSADNRARKSPYKHLNAFFDNHRLYPGGTGPRPRADLTVGPPGSDRSALETRDNTVPRAAHPAIRNTENPRIKLGAPAPFSPMSVGIAHK